MQTTQTISVSPSGRTTYTVTVTDGNGCQGQDTHDVDVNAGPTPTIAGPTDMCDGASVVLDAGAGYASYLWSTGETTQTISVSPATSTAYTVTVTDGNGCQGQDSHTVTVNPNPTPTITGPTDVCPGGSVVLDAGAGYASYLWSTGETTQQITVSPAAMTTYTVTVTDGSGCQGMDSHTVSIGAGANPTISGPTDTCAGQSVVLDAGGPYAAYLWSTGETTQQITVNPATTTTYDVTVTTIDGCMGMDSHLVTVTPDPVADAGPDGALTCDTTIVTLQGSASGGSGGYTYSWSPATGLSNPNIATPTTTQTGTWTLTVTDTLTGCTSTDTVTVVLNNAPPVVTAGPDKLIDCTNPTVQLDGNTNSTNFSFYWDPTSGLQNPGSIVPICDTPGTYTLHVTDLDTGCVNQDTVIVTSNFVAPTAGFTASDNNVCVNEQICFTNQSTNYLDLLWDFGTGVNFSTAENPCFSWTSPGDYMVTLDANNNCGTDSESIVVTIDPTPVSSFTYSGQGGKICAGQVITFSDTSTNNPTSWFWDFGDPASGANNTSTLQNPTHTFATDGVYIVTLIATNDCGQGTIYQEAVSIPASCNTNCSANSNQIDCNDTGPLVLTGDTTVDFDNTNTTYYDCITQSYPGENVTYDFNYLAGSTFYVTLTETGPDPSLYELDLMISETCNPYTCVAWGDSEVWFNDRNSQDYWLIVDGRAGFAQPGGPYELTVHCMTPTETDLCSPPTFAGVVQAQDDDPCALGGIEISWNPVTSWGNDNAGAPCLGGTYEVLRAPASDPTNETTVASGLTITTFVDTTVVPGIDYNYRVNAINGCCGKPALTSNVETAADTVSAEPEFVGITAANDLDSCADSGVLIQWDAATSFGSPTGTYRVLRSTQVDCSNPTTLASGLTGLSYTDTSLQPNQDYYYYVEAVSECGASSAGTGGCLHVVDVQGIGDEPSALDQNPAAPPLLATRAAGAAVSMTWEANSSLYNVYRGSLASLQNRAYDHQEINACDIGTNSAVVDPGAGSFYYIVTGKPCVDGQESSYGRNSIGQERPDAATASGNPCP